MYYISHAQRRIHGGILGILGSPREPHGPQAYGAPDDRWSEWPKRDVFPGMVIWPKTKAKKEGGSFRNMTVDQGVF